MRVLRFGLVGCGGAAADLCRAVDALDWVRVVAAHDRVESAARRLAAPRGARVHVDLPALLANPAVDVVYVALPHDRLAGAAEEALRAGHHVLVEKPMAIDPGDVHRLDRLARVSGLVLGAVFELREVTAIREARALVEGGAIGQIESVRIRTVIDKPATYWQTGLAGSVADGWRASLARAGGGLLLMNAIHQIDLVRFLTGQEFVRATAETATWTPSIEVEDAAAAVLRLSGGAIVSLAAAAHSAGATLEERIELDGRLGRLDLPDPYGDGTLRVYLRRPWSDLAAGEWTDIPAIRRDPYVELIRRFAAAVTAGPEVATDLPGARDAAAALSTVRAMYRSAVSGRAEPVDAPPDRGDGERKVPDRDQPGDGSPP